MPKHAFTSSLATPTVNHAALSFRCQRSIVPTGMMSAPLKPVSTRAWATSSPGSSN